MKLFPYSGTSNQQQIYSDTPPYYVDEATANVTYVAWLSKSGAQTIMQVDESAHPYTIGFAYGEWAGRSALTYVDWLTYSNSGDWEE